MVVLNRKGLSATVGACAPGGRIGCSLATARWFDQSDRSSAESRVDERVLKTTGPVVQGPGSQRVVAWVRSNVWWRGHEAKQGWGAGRKRQGWHVQESAGLVTRADTCRESYRVVGNSSGDFDVRGGGGGEACPDALRTLSAHGGGEARVVRALHTFLTPPRAMVRAGHTNRRKKAKRSVAWRSPRGSAVGGGPWAR